jgi:hypothetical protein
MYKFKAVMFLALLTGFGHTALAEAPVVFRDNVLTIPDAVVIEGGEVTHYRNIELTLNNDGNFVVAKAKQGQLATIESVEIITDQDKVDVVAKGWRSACVDILPAAVSRKGNEFVIAIAETEPSSDVCILIAISFEVATTLNTAGLEAGDYTVLVNGQVAQFTL